jgi:hypothetical protein
MTLEKFANLLNAFIEVQDPITPEQALVLVQFLEFVSDRLPSEKERDSE